MRAASARGDEAVGEHAALGGAEEVESGAALRVAGAEEPGLVRREERRSQIRNRY